MTASTTTLAVGPTALERARKILSRYTLAELMKTEVKAFSDPDTTNPGGYYHLWVVLERPVLFGFFKLYKTLYFERAAFDDSEQRRVYHTAKSLLDALKAF